MIDLLCDWKLRRDVRYAVTDAVRSVRNRFVHPVRPPARAGLFAAVASSLPGARLFPLASGIEYTLDVRIIGDAGIVSKFPNPGCPKFSVAFVGELAGGHFLGPNGDVFVDQEMVFTDVCPQYGVKRDRHRLIAAGRIPAFRHLDGNAVAVLGCTTPNNYYHWLFECLGRFDLLQKAGVSPDRICVPMSMAWQRSLLAQCGFPAHRLVPLEGGHFRANRLHFTSLPGDNSASVYSSIKSAEVYRAVAMRVRKAVGWGCATSPDLNIFIGRRNGRRLWNMDALLAQLERRGRWTVVYMEDMSLKEAAGLLGRAKRVAGVHGAAFANMMLFHPECVVLELMSYSMASYDYAAMAKSLGLRHAYLACEAPRWARWQRRHPLLGMVVPPGSLARLDDALAAA